MAQDLDNIQDRLVLVVARHRKFQHYVDDAYARICKVWKECKSVGNDHGNSRTVMGANQNLTWKRVDPRDIPSKWQGFDRRTTGFVVLDTPNQDLLLFLQSRHGAPVRAGEM